MKNENTTTSKRYSDADLQEFKTLVLKKLAATKEELETITVSMQFNNPNGTDDTGASYTTIEESADTLGKEIYIQSIARYRKFISDLSAALVRIENKTYGICRSSGELIPKQRLFAVPHTTMCIEAKLKR